jgi:peptide/nickel transport system ATP-binding protein
MLTDQSLMSNTILDIRNLQVQFTTQERQVVAVDDLNIKLQKGQTLGIVGESGSGKSVTSLAIMGLIQSPGKVTQGEIFFQGREDETPIDLLKLPEDRRRLYRGGAISMIFQEPMSSLNPVYDIGFQLIEAILLHQNISKSEARRQAIARLQEVKLLPSDENLKQQYYEELKVNHKINGTIQNNDQIQISEKEINQYINNIKQAILKRYPHELSGGQLQRVMIAMAIACNPEILIADEPTTALDVTVQATILDLLRELCKSREMSLIFITHDLGVIAELVDTVAVMYQGKVVEFGEIKDIFLSPKHPYTKGLLACRPRLDQKLKYLPTVSDFMTETRNEKGELLLEEKIQDQEKSLQIIEENHQQAKLEQILKNQPLLEVNNLKVGFRQKGIFGKTQKYFMAVNDISFNLYPGETLGLVGESGCGKSTLARTLLCLIPALEGKIIFRGENLATWHHKNSIFNFSKDKTKIKNISEKRLRNLRREMQIVFQNPYNSLNPRMSIGKAILEPMLIHKVGGNYQKQKERVYYLLERVGLDPNLFNRYPHEFSGGQRQRICIARALALNPQFIICDESVSALDVSVQAQVLNLLKELQEELGLTYIFISHDLSVVKFMSDRIMVMNKGKIEEIDTAQEIYTILKLITPVN